MTFILISISPNNDVVHKYEYQYHQAEQVKQTVPDQWPPGQVQNLNRTPATKTKCQVLKI